jgi:hypothetical protein
MSYQSPGVLSEFFSSALKTKLNDTTSPQMELLLKPGWVLGRNKLTLAEMQQHVYNTLLFRAPEAAEFLFSDRFADTLKAFIDEPHLRATYFCDIDRSIDQFGRFIAPKAFVADTDGLILSPHPLWISCGTPLFSTPSFILNCKLP